MSSLLKNGVAALALSSVSTASEIEAPPVEEKIEAPKPTPESTPNHAAAGVAAGAFSGTVAGDTAETLTDGAEAVGNMSDAADAVDGDIVMDVLSGVFF